MVERNLAVRLIFLESGMNLAVRRRRSYDCNRRKTVRPGGLKKKKGARLHAVVSLRVQRPERQFPFRSGKRKNDDRTGKGDPRREPARSGLLADREGIAYGIRSQY